MSQLTVHHLENSRSTRVLWLLEELGVDYDIKRYKRTAENRAPAALREVHPLGKAPVVTLDDGTVLAESGAIIEELLDRHTSSLRPEAGTEEARRFRFFLHYAEGSLAPPLLVKLIFQVLRKAPMPFFVKPVVKGIAAKVDANFTNGEILSHLRFLEAELTERDYFAGEAFTAADIQMMVTLEFATGRTDMDTYPKIAAFIARMREREAYQRAEEKGGKVV